MSHFYAFLPQQSLPALLFLSFFPWGPEQNCAFGGNFQAALIDWALLSRMDSSEFERRIRASPVNLFCEETGSGNCADVSGKLGEV